MFISLNPFGTGQCLTTESASSIMDVSDLVSIPLEQGSVLRQIASKLGEGESLESQSLWNRAVSYDLRVLATKANITRLNPFGTGQCLTTLVQKWMDVSGNVSIPLEQGSVLRLNEKQRRGQFPKSLNPFGTGQCLTTNQNF